MKDSLLVCIAFHYNPDRVKYLLQVVDNFKSYPIPVAIKIYTNARSIKGLEHLGDIIYPCENLEHPFHLTWKTRETIKIAIDLFDNFMYIEDDMLLPYKNYKNYLENFELLWPNYIPSFIRVEEAKGKQFITDATEPQKITKIVGHDGSEKIFTKLTNPYHAFWIMPQKELKETMIKNFDRLSDSRETAASYPMWELNKTPLVEIELKDKYYVKESCYSYHLPNNYAMSEESRFAKVELQNIFL